MSEANGFPRRMPLVWMTLALAACAQTTPPAGPTEPHDPASASKSPAEPTSAAEVATASAPEPEPEPAEPPPPPVNCQSGESFGPLVLTEAEAATRHGRDTRALAELTSSKQRPVEVCGPVGETDLLMQLTCADGSQPLGDRRAAMDARTGSVGTGGRCGKVVDLYEVSCPEKTYEVYMDMYFCGPGENFEP